MYTQMLTYRLMSDHSARHGEFYLGSSLLEGQQRFPEGRRTKAAVDALLRQGFGLKDGKDCIPKEYGHFLLFDTSTGRPLLSQLAGELWADFNGASRANSDFDLLAAVMAKGAEHSFYGNDSGVTFDQLHLFVCGIDWSAFEGVTSERWYNFAGTFAEEQDKADVMEARVMCRCPDRVTLKFGLEMPSIAKVFVSLSADQLEELFD